MAQPGRKFDVSVVLPFHAAGEIAARTLVAMAQCKAEAVRAGLSVEVLALLDAADPATELIVEMHLRSVVDRMDKVAYRDLGLTRNHGISLAGGAVVLVVDGDDFISRTLIMQGWQAASGDPHAVFHPEYVVNFGAAKSIVKQFSSERSGFDERGMLRSNPWNACAIAHRTIFENIPYRPAVDGTGFEDWHWNCETIASGHPHRIIEGAVHFARIKQTGSLNARMSGEKRVIPRTRLFDASEARP